MADVSVWEMQDSMSGSVENDTEDGETRNVTRRYLIGKCVGFNDAVSQIQPYAPRYVTDAMAIYWRRARLNVRGVGNGYIDVSAEYETLTKKSDGGGGDQPEGGTFVPGTLSWDTSGTTEHITQGLTEERHNAPGVADQSFEKAINVSGESVEGLDVVRPSLSYAETWILPVQKAMSPDFIYAVYSLTGSVNEDVFRTFQPGEALFMGARGTWAGDQPYVAIEFSFQCRPNITMESIGDIPGGWKKNGWDYLWIRYETQAATGTLFRKPIVAYVNKVYPSKSWDDLGIVFGVREPAQPVNPADIRAGRAALGPPGRPAGVNFRGADPNL